RRNRVSARTPLDPAPRAPGSFPDRMFVVCACSFGAYFVPSRSARDRVRLTGRELYRTRLGDREPHRERGSDTHLTDHRDRTSERLDHLLRQREAKAEALFLRGYEVIKNRRKPLYRNTAPSVGDFHDRLVVLTPGPDQDAAARRSRLKGIRNQIAVNTVQC